LHSDSRPAGGPANPSSEVRTATIFF
jgi:hypothetical protein